MLAGASPLYCPSYDTQLPVSAMTAAAPPPSQIAAWMSYLAICCFGTRMGSTVRRCPLLVNPEVVCQPIDDMGS